MVYLCQNMTYRKRREVFDKCTCNLFAKKVAGAFIEARNSAVSYFFAVVFFYFYSTMNS